MSLIKWSNDGTEDPNNTDNLFNPTPPKQVASVQSTWQPTQDNTQPSADGTPTDAQSTDNNYLMSDQHAQVDEQLRQRKAAEAAARAEAARQAEIARQNAAAASTMQVQTQVPQAAKYAGGQKKNEGGFTGFLKDVGSGIQQGIASLGDIAIEGGGVIGSFGKNGQDLVNHMAEVEKVRNWLHGMKDFNGNNFVGTQNVDQNAANIAAGRGNAQDYAAVAGKGLQAGLDATMFINPARMALTPAALPEVARASTMLGRVATNPVVQNTLRDAAFYGGLQGTATAAGTYGETGDLTKSLETGAQDALTGAILQGTLDSAGHLTRKGFERLIPVLKDAANTARNTLTPVTDHAGELATDGIQTAEQRLAQLENAPKDAITQAGIKDGNIALEPIQQLKPVDPITTMPVNAPTPAPNNFQSVADGMAHLTSDVTPTAEPNAQIPQPKPNEVKTALDAQMNQPAPVQAQPAPSTAPATVADGVVKPATVLPAADPKVPMVKAEQVKALQEAKAGASQAQEAAINQELNKVNNQIPSINKPAETYLDGTPVDPNNPRPLSDSTRPSERLNTGIDNGVQQIHKIDAQRELIKAGYTGEEAQHIIDTVARPGANNISTSNLEQAAIAFDKAANGETKLIIDIPKQNLATQRAGLVPGDTHETALAKIDTALENGQITPAEHAAIEDHLFNQASQTGDMIAQTADTSVPDGMNSADTPPVDPNAPMTPKEVAQRLMPKLANSNDMKAHLADAVGMKHDASLPVRDILSAAGVDAGRSERVASLFDKLDQQLKDYNAQQKINQAAYAKDGTAGLDPNVSRTRSRISRDMGATTRQLVHEINKLDGSRDFKVKLVNNLVDIIGTRNANILSSVGGLERNAMQEITANAKLALKNPIKMAKSTFNNGNILVDTAKGELSHWKDLPRNPVEGMKYLIGNTYRTGMIPTTALARTRNGAIRDELTKWAYQALEKRKVSSAEAHKLAGTAGNEMEALVNTLAGVDNGMTNRSDAMKALKSWKEYITTGGDGAHAEFLKRVEEHTSLADQMIAGLSKEDATKVRGLKAIGSLIFPFVKTASNLARNTVSQDLNPLAKSVLDEIRADQRSGAGNAMNILKSKLVDYGIMSGAVALANAGVIGYNNGDSVDKPQGVYIDLGNNQYVPVRATAFELPIAMAVASQQMWSDINSGHPRDWTYYAGIVGNSLPYVDSFNQATGVIDSLAQGDSSSGDNMYAAKSYAINMGKSFVPFSNNGVVPATAAAQGKSLNAKSTYDKNMGTWFKNSVEKSYMPVDQYNQLPDSRDNAGRVRTVDNQGVIINKTINDAPTAEFNKTIDSLVKYGRENSISNGTQDAFNTYDKGQNNNFRSAQGAIAFLDVPQGQNPSSADKLKKNSKLTDLAKQIHDGFFGDTGSELLTLDGKNLKSDASVPNKDGSKNSNLPMSMQSIKNAVAQTDLPKDQTDQLYQYSQAKTDLYNQLHNKQISYDQYKAAKGQIEQSEVSILSNSKNYQKLNGLMNELSNTGFFNDGGFGSTKSGQTYFWNSINSLLGSKGSTPAANYADSSNGNGFTPWGRRGGNGINATDKFGDRGNTGVQWKPVTARQMATVQSGKYTPVSIKVDLGNEIKKNKTQNYAKRSF